LVNLRKPGVHEDMRLADRDCYTHNNLMANGFKCLDLSEKHSKLTTTLKELKSQATRHQRHHSI
jgi:hypothetical protein